jgi:hypothetical protein
MAWRPARFLFEGMLDNTSPKKVAGWMRFAGIEGKVTFDLSGDFHRDIRGAKIRFTGEAQGESEEARKYMEGFARHQTGKVGDMTAGLQPADYVSGYCYLEWYSNNNGRVVIELDQDKVKLLTKPIPAHKTKPISRAEQDRNMQEFLRDMVRSASKSRENTACPGSEKTIGAGRTTPRRMQLLTQEIRDKLPPLYGQEGKGGKAVAYVKFFTPDSNWTWWATEGSSVKDASGKEVDFHFFGLVDGLARELGYFSLSELESVRGPLGLPVERDLYWQPKTLEEIAPEMFGKPEGAGD